jgi:hypothetical protein
MRAIDLLKKAPVLSGLLYGDSGTGKTTWCAMAPSPLILLFEGHGLASIAMVNPNADVELIRDANHFDLFINAIKQGCADDDDFFVVTGKKETKRFKTLVIDGLTQLTSMYCKAYPGKDGPNWNVVQDKIRQLLDDLRSLPVNSICTALQKDFYYKNAVGEDRRRVVPALAGQLAVNVNQYFACVAYAYKRKKGYTLAFDIAADNCVTKRAPGSQGVVDKVVTVDIFDDKGNVKDECFTFGTLVDALKSKTAKLLAEANSQ